MTSLGDLVWGVLPRSPSLAMPLGPETASPGC